MFESDLIHEKLKGTWLPFCLQRLTHCERLHTEKEKKKQYNIIFEFLNAKHYSISYNFTAIDGLTVVSLKYSILFYFGY